MVVRALAFVCAVLVTGVASADPDVGDDPPADTIALTRVTMVRAGTIARFEARFELTVTGPAPETQNTQSFEIPEGAVITGATVRVGDHVERLQLERFDKVDAAFSALMERPGVGRDRKWAVRIDATGSDARIAIDAAYDAKVTVDMTLEAPTCFVDDARHVKVPEDWAARLPATMMPAMRADELDEICVTSVRGPWVALPSGELAKQRAGEARIGVTVGRLPLAGRDVARVEVALAGALTDIPKDLYTAIVVDHSRSLTETERDNERAIIEAYVRATPRSRVQVIEYARTAEPLLPSWMIAERAVTRIDRAIRGMPPRNGSNVDEGLAVAGAWLANIQGTRRVLLLTDERVADRLTTGAPELRNLLPADTLVHAITVTGAAGIVQRSDDSLFAPFALATGGIAALAGVDENGDFDALPLARPVTLDNLELNGPGWTGLTADDRACPGEFETPFAEGHSCVAWFDGKPTSGDITLSGWLWGHKVTRVVRPEASQARSVARTLSMLSALAPELELEVKTAAHAVNSVWSLFGMWGGTGGYQDIELWGFGLSGVGIGGISSRIVDTIGTVGTTRARLDLRPQLAGVVERCHGSRALLMIETTLEEIVDVKVYGVYPDVAQCIEDGVWDTTLLLPDAPAHAHTTVDFQPT